VLDELLDRAPALRADPTELRRRRDVARWYDGVRPDLAHVLPDARIGAAIVMAGVHDNFASGRYVHQTVPVLRIQGDADIGYHHSRSAPPAAGATQVVHHPARRAALSTLRGPAGPVAGVVDVTTTLF
jgi:hypothetical protein